MVRGGVRHDGRRHLSARLSRTAAPRRRAGAGGLGHPPGDGGLEDAAHRAGGHALRDPVRDDARLLAADPQQRADRSARLRGLGMAVPDAGGARRAGRRGGRGHRVQPDRIGDGGALREARQPHPAAGWRSDGPIAGRAVAAAERRRGRTDPDAWRKTHGVRPAAAQWGHGVLHRPADDVHLAHRGEIGAARKWFLGSRGRAALPARRDAGAL